MKPTQILEHEHEVILRVLQVAEDEVRRMDESGTLREQKIEQIVDFLRNFADRCHHAKEEKRLFVFMQERGMSAEHGPIAVMLAEHEQGREYARAIISGLEQARNGNTSGVKQVRDNLAAYIVHLRQHIYKENNILFPMAARMMTPADEAALLEDFERIEREDVGEGVHEKYHHLAEELTEQ
jgi:hemerythrin-like domain-containing protein